MSIGSWMKRYLQARGIDPETATPKVIAWAKINSFFEKCLARGSGAEKALADALLMVEARDPEMLARWEVRLNTDWTRADDKLIVTERSAVERLADLGE